MEWYVRCCGLLPLVLDLSFFSRQKALYHLLHLSTLPDDAIDQRRINNIAFNSHHGDTVHCEAANVMLNSGERCAEVPT